VLEQVLPFQSRFVTVAGYRMHYIDEGSGPTVLLLHGNPTWCFFYRNVIRELKDSFRLIAPDFLGCGLSDRTPGVKFRAIDRINQLEEFVTALGITNFSIVMHDWGGPLGTGFIQRRLDSVNRIVYLNTTLTETEALPGFIKLAATPIVGKLMTRHTDTFVRMTTSVGAHKKLTPEVVDGYRAPYRSRQRRDAIWDFVADIPFGPEHPTYTEMVNIAANLPRVAEKPVKIIWGLKDPCFHREMLSKVAAHFPHAELLEIPDASHLVLDDAPQLAIPAIKEFLSRPTEKLGSAPVSAPSEREQGKIHVVYDQVMRWAQETPTASAVVVPRWVRDPINGSALHYSHTTYGDLAKLVNQYQRGLSELGLVPGDRVLMLVSPGADFLALGLAVMGRGATPVFVDPGIGLEKLSRCIQDAAPHAFIGSPRAHLLRFLKRSLFHRVKFHVTASEWAFTGGYSLGFFKRFANVPLKPVPLPVLATGVGTHLKASDAALIAFTSGATGTPKGVIFTNEMLAHQLGIIRDVLGQQAGTRDLTLLPIFSLYNVALGVASVFPTMPVGKPLAFDAAQVVKLVGDLGVESSFGSPTLWHKIAEYTLRTGSTLPTMRRVFMAGAAVPASTLELVKKAIPNGEASTPYGATEALPVTFITATELQTSTWEQAVTGEQGTPVGKLIPGIELRVIKSSEDPIASIEETQLLSVGEIGEILVKGATVSPEYLHRVDANKIGKVRDGDGFWHRMGDLGYVDSRGFLYYCGRKAHSVYTPEKTFHSVPVEEIFNTLPQVRRSALVGVRGGKEAAIVIEPYPQFFPDSEAEAEKFVAQLRDCAECHSLSKGITKFFFHKSFPVDARHNAKIYRDQLGEWADKMLSMRRAA
jgi:acyl-CoA synthetase (AMP-forming)/AMP-acid ligase II/pimeloyl-ACP methyl ester carboxylesterase